MGGSIWSPGSTPQVNVDTLRVTQEFTATAGQTVFNLTSFTYAYATNSLEVFKNGLSLLPSQVSEDISGTQFALSPCSLGDKILAIGLVGVTAVANVPADGTVTNAKLNSAFLLPLTNGGTGATTAAGARGNLGITPAAIGALSTGDVGSVVEGYNPNLVDKTVANTFTASQTFSGNLVPRESFCFRNKLYNGNFDIWQRGTSFSGADQYTADRWYALRAGGVTNKSVTQVTTGYVAGMSSNTNVKLQRTVGDTSVASVGIVQALESIDSIPYRGKDLVLSFWARCGANFSSTANSLSVAILSGTGTDQAPNSVWTGQANVVSQVVTLTTTWQRFYVTGTAATNVSQLKVYFEYIPTGTAGAADQIELAEVQLEQGTVPTPYETIPYGLMLTACQRYFFTTYQMGVAPGTAGQQYLGDCQNIAINTADFYTYGSLRFPVCMRTIPTVQLYNPVTGQTATFYDYSTATTNGSSATTSVSSKGISRIYCSNNVLVAGHVIGTHVTASAEL